MKGCYGKGGKIRPKTIHGLRTGQHNNPNVLRAARASGGSCEVKQVDGKKPPMRMDRPMRGKYADGGSPANPGEIADTEQKKYLIEKAAKKREDAREDFKGAAMNAGATLANITAPKFTRGRAKLKNAAANATAGATGGIGFSALASGLKNRSDADTAEKEAEGFKSGGWIAGATKNKGALHRALKVPTGEKIPVKKLEKAEHSSNPKIAKEANLAETLKGFKK